MNIKYNNNNGVLSFHIPDIEFTLKQERPTVYLDDTVFAEFPGVLHINYDFMHSNSVVSLMDWMYKTEGIVNALAVKEYIKTIVKKQQKRKYSTSHRIEIAYKSQYKCNSCKMLLPPTFEVDHIIELQDGGKDEYNNLQALCPNCHALKTRANVLRRDKSFKEEFGKRFDIMQTNAFKEFEYKPKLSKYF